MAEAISVSGPISGTDNTLSFETGRLAPQSQGAVVGRIGDTMVLVTANASHGVREGIDFFPLTVDIEERAYAAGKIPGSFFRREGRPTDQAILTCRLIDRPLRPSFADGYRNETQVVGTILGADQENPHDIVAINAASAALMISGIPFEGPIGAVRIAWTTEGKWVPHPTYQAGDEATSAISAEVGAEVPELEKEIKAAVRSLTKELVRKRVVDEGKRMDGRGPTDLRPLSAEVGILPTSHGTCLFQRGETQVLTVTSLGMPRMSQMLDTIGIDDSKRYMHHYNMPPWANGETGRVGSPKRREIGHGLLAERALLPVVPDEQEFSYTLRLVSEVLSSNGSTSMASVCGSSLSLMDAGVPIKAPVAGIAMGLIYAEGKYTTLTDILGAEDAFGDMDFKVAGTSEFVTALQLDTKIDGLPSDVLTAALQQAKEARLSILGVMANTIAEPRPEVNETAPKIVSFEIPMDRVGEVIGPKGKVINGIQQETGADINVDDDGHVGTVTIGGRDGGAVAEAKRMIELILNPPEADVGGIYTGKVVNITKFGAFVNILPGRDGLLHISKLGSGKRVDRVEDVLSLGAEVEVRVDDIDPQGKVSLSLVKPLDGTAGNGGGGGGGGSAEGGGGGGSGGGAGGDRDVVSFDADWDQTARDSFGELGPAEAS